MATSYYHDLLIDCCAAAAVFLARHINPNLDIQADPIFVSEVSRYQALGKPRESREARVDLAAYFKNGSKLLQLIEVQLRPDPSKHDAWILYITFAYRKFHAPVSLGVIVPDEATATWAKRAIEVLAGQPYVPAVIGPEELSIIKGLEVLSDDLDAAVLCMAMHPKNPDAAELWAAVWDTVEDGLPKKDNDEDSGSQGEPPKPKESKVAETLNQHYINVIQFCTTEEWWNENVRENMPYITYTEAIRLEGEKRGISIGEKRGEKRGELRRTREMIIRLAKANNVTLSDVVLQRIEREQDLSRLDEWVDLVERHKNIELVLPE